MMEEQTFATQHPWITAVGAFRRYPKLGTIENLRQRVDKDGLRWFDAVAVEDTMRHEVPFDLTDCEKCGGATEIEQVCDAGFAVYRCPKCGQSFRVVSEFSYYFQEVVE